MKISSKAIIKLIIYFFEADVQYLEEFREIQNDLFFWPDRTKIDKVEQFLGKSMIRRMLYT